MNIICEKFCSVKSDIVVVLVVTWLTSGCALTSPASEQLVFRQKQKQDPRQLFYEQHFSTLPQDHSSIFKPSFLLYYLKVTFRPPSGELAYAKRKFSSYIDHQFEQFPHLTKDDLSIRNPYYFSIAVPVPIIEKPDAYWSMNVGFPVLSTDITVDLGNNFYSTATFGIADGELIVQKKLLHTEKQLGLAMGGYYRAERRGFEITSNEAGLVIGPIIDWITADRIFYTHTIGPRLNGLIPLNDHSFIQARIAPGYSITLERAVLNFGFTLQLSTN